MLQCFDKLYMQLDFKIAKYKTQINLITRVVLLNIKLL